MPADKEFTGKTRMTCEEFATAGLDLDWADDSALQQAARDHLRNCPHCAALQEHWLLLREDLHTLGRETGRSGSPARVEMRLRQEFRTKHKTLKTRRAAVVATWALAAAAVLLLAVSWVRWQSSKTPVAAVRPAPGVTVPGNASQLAATFAPTDLSDTVAAANDSGEFTLLPGSVPSATEDATVVHVEMQRAALGAMGLTVNEERAGDWIQVDLLIGDDGVPQAVRLPAVSN